MPRKTRRPASTGENRAFAAGRSHWRGYVVTALVSLGLGSGGTYLAFRPALHRPSAVAVSSPAPPVGLVPPAILTTGLPPAEAALNLGNWYEDHNDFPHAITAYTQAINGGIDNPNIRTDLGVAYYKSGQPQKALEQYQSAQRQDPHHENSLYNQGTAYAEMGNAAQAVSIWQQYRERFPQGQHATEAQQLIAEVQAHHT